MMILNAIAKGAMGAMKAAPKVAMAKMAKAGEALRDPRSHLQSILDENEILAMMQDPEMYERFLAQQMAKRDDSAMSGIPDIPGYQSVGMPGGGFVRNNPAYMNTNQLILSGMSR